MKKKPVILIMLCAFLLMSACATSNKEPSGPLDFLEIKTGSSKEDVLKKFPNANIMESGINCDNIDTDYGSKNTLAYFSLNDSNQVFEMGVNWRAITEKEAKKIYDSLKSKAEAKYGDSYDATHGDEVSERCIWETDDYRVCIILELGTSLNGNLVDIEYTDYNMF